MKSLMSHRSTRRARALLPLVAAATLIAGCAGGASSGGSAATANLTGSPIVIGALIDQSSPSSSSDKGTADVLTAWAAHVNGAGGIAGHPVEVRIQDTRSDAPTATTMAQEMIADKSVVAVLMSSSGIEGAVGPVFAGSDVAVSGVGYNPRVWSALKNFYTITTTFPAVVNMQVASARNVQATTVASLACAENPNCLSAVPVLEAAAKAASVSYAGVIQISAAAPGYTAECLKMINEHVAFAQLSASEETAGRLVTDCQRQGYDGWFGASAGSVTPGLYGDVPNIRLAGGLNGFPWWGTSPAAQAFRDAMAAQGVAETTYGGPHATGMWAAAEMLRTALKATTPQEPVTRAAVQTGYGAIKNETLGGLLPMPVSYTAGQPAPKVSCYWLYTFQDGKFSDGGAAPSCDGSAS